MAMVKCNECKQEISDKAEKCPHCGAPLPKKSSMLKLIFIALFGFAIIGMIMRTDSTPSTPSPSASTPAAKPTPKTWEYSNNTDKVSGKQATQASLLSDNRFQLDFPYQGGTVGELQVRKHPRYGKDIIFSVNKGQLLCSVSGCQVSVKVDGKPPYKVSATEPADHSSDTLFLGSYDKLLKDIKASKKVIIEVTFFQQGSKPFEFNTAGLKWE